MTPRPFTFTCDSILCSGQIANTIGAALLIEGMALDSGSHFLKLGGTYRRFDSRQEAQDYATELAQDADCDLTGDIHHQDVIAGVNLSGTRQMPKEEADRGGGKSTAQAKEPTPKGKDRSMNDAVYGVKPKPKPEFAQERPAKDTPIAADPEEVKKLYAQLSSQAAKKKDNKDASREQAKWYGNVGDLSASFVDRARSVGHEEAQKDKEEAEAYNRELKLRVRNTPKGGQLPPTGR